jgi:RNA polymerase sigma-70 factor (ECF subfamily)
MYTTSSTLLERLRRPGDQEAWGRFVRLYTPLLFYWVRRANVNGQDAEDLVQDVLLRVVKAIPAFDHSKGRFRAWLTEITRNRIRDLRRRRGLIPADAAALENHPQASHESSQEEVQYRAQLLSQALELLKPGFQPTSWQAFLEHGLKGRPAAAVAAELDLSLGAVYAAKFRVLARLRELLHGLIE